MTRALLLGAIVLVASACGWGGDEPGGPVGPPMAPTQGKPSAAGDEGDGTAPTRQSAPPQSGATPTPEAGVRSDAQRPRATAGGAAAGTGGPGPGAGTRSFQNCPVTLPNQSTPPGVQGWATEGSSSYGNGGLWTLFWPNNTVLADPDYILPDGSIRMKWPWWRGVPGELSIEGRRLDAPAAPLRAEARSSGYGRAGFLPSTIYFPTEGCWEVTGRVGEASLSFVTLVRKVSTTAGG